MKAFLIIVAYDYKTSDWQPKMKKFLTIGNSLEKATENLLADFREYNSKDVMLNARAVNASEIDAEVVLPVMKMPVIPNA